LFEVDKLEHSHVILIGYGFEHMAESFSFEEFFFFLEYFIQIDLMQSLVGIIDKQLLQTIAFEYLKTIYIQKAKIIELLIALIA
jgi:hypothetical protein